MKYPAWMMVLLLTGCGINGRVQTEAIVIDSSCSWAKPILISKRDALTDGTAKQILSHNELATKNCPPR